MTESTTSNNHHSSDSVLTAETFSSQEVSDMTGVSLRQLQWWDEQGVVSPVQRGHRRLYQLHEVIEVGLITELRRKGISLQKIRKVLTYLKKKLGVRFASAVHDGGEIHVLTDGKKIYLEHDHKSIVDILKNADQPIISVCISDQVERLSSTFDLKKGVKTETRKAGAGQARGAAQPSS